MPNEQSKATKRRFNDGKFHSLYFVGKGIDVGAGKDGLSKYKYAFPRITEVKDWDIPDGDAQHMKGVPNNTYNFLNSSHCFEHLVDPRVSLRNWIRIVKPGGYLLITIPDEDMYEQGNWPSKFNGHHKTSFTIAKKKSWSRASVNVLDLLSEVSNLVEVIKVEKVDDLYDYSKKGPDQTLDQCVECAIEIVLRKR